MDIARRSLIWRWAIVAGIVLVALGSVAAYTVLRSEPIPLVDDTLVFLSPHPDDETYSASMTLAENVRAGRHVAVVLLTDGEGSKDADWWIDEHGEDLDDDDDIDRWDFGLSRRAEFEAAMRILGVSEWEFLGAADSQGERGIRDGEIAETDVDALVARIANTSPGATLATVMKAIPDDPYLGDVHPHEDHTMLCEAVHAWATESGETAYFFKPYASLDAAWYRRSAPHKLRADEEIHILRAKAIAEYQLIGRRSWYVLYFANMDSDFEYMVTSDEF